MVVRVTETHVVHLTVLLGVCIVASQYQRITAEPGILKDRKCLIDNQKKIYIKVREAFKKK